MLAIFCFYIASIMSVFAQTELEKTGEDVTYLLDVSKHQGDFDIGSQTPFKKLRSVQGVHDRDLGKVNLSALSCIESDGININAYPRLIILGPGKIRAQDLNQRILANTEIARAEFDVGAKSYIQVFPELKFGRTSAFVYYGMPNAPWCQKYSFSTKVDIYGTIELPFRDKEWSYAKKCGSTQDPHLHLVKTNLTVHDQGSLVVGNAGHSKIHVSRKGTFYGGNGYIHLEDSVVKTPKFHSSLEAKWDVAGDVFLHAKDGNKSSIRGKLTLNCQDERWASDVQCYFNKTVLKLKNVSLLQTTVRAILAFDPKSKQCSIGCVELSNGDTTTHVNLDVICTRSEYEASEIVDCLSEQKLPVFKYKKKPGTIPITFKGTGDKQLRKMNKKIVLLDDPKEFCLYLAVVPKG